jgi:hypothetical protein
VYDPQFERLLRGPSPGRQPIQEAQKWEWEYPPQTTQDPFEQQNSNSLPATQDPAEQQNSNTQPPEKKMKKKRSSSVDSKPDRKHRRSDDSKPAYTRRYTVASHRLLTLDILEQSPQVLLRRVFFLNAERSRYVSVVFYPARFHYVLIEFGGAHLSPIIITEQQLMTISEHLPKLCEAMCRSEHYACKDGVFRLLYSGGNRAVAIMCLDKRYIIFKLADLCYLMNMLNFVQVY